MKFQSILLFILVFNFNNLFSQDFDLNISTIPDSLKQNANAVILYDDINIELVSYKKMIVKVKKAITVLSELGDANKYVVIGYDKNRKIKSKKTVIYNASGDEIKKVKNKEYRDVSKIDGGTLYSDNRMLYYEYIPTAYPYTIYYEYEIETSNTAFIPVWYPLESYSTSVVSSTFNLKYSDNLNIQIKENNFHEFKITKNKAANNIYYSLSNIKPIKKEPLSPSLKKILPYVQFVSNQFSLEGISGVATNWKELGKWEYDNLYKDVGQLSNSAKEKAKQLVAGIDNPLERAKIIYQYVQDKTRYISVQVGIGGLKPMLANDVDKLGYGDCKALTNYTKSLLDVVGVESYFTELYGGYEKIDMDFNSPNIQGNHVILNIPTETEDIWLECTNQKVPFGYIANFTDDRDVIVIRPEGGVIKHTKIYKTQTNLQFTKGKYSIDDQGNIKASLSIESSGTQYNDNLQRYEGQSKKELDVLFKNYLSNINNIKFSKIEIHNNKKESKYEEQLEFTASDYTSFSGNQTIVTINAFNKNSYIPKRVRNRKLPFQISRGYVDIDNVKINFSSSYSMKYLPEKVEIISKFGKYSMEVLKLDDYNYLYKRKLLIEEGKYPKEDYNNYRNFKKQIVKYDKTKIILLKK